jgi:hypothetical protein
MLDAPPPSSIEQIDKKHPPYTFSLSIRSRPEVTQYDAIRRSIRVCISLLPLCRRADEAEQAGLRFRYSEAVCSSDV